MSPSFDCAISSLLCGEDNNGIFDVGLVEEYEDKLDHRYHRIHNRNRAFNGGYVGLPIPSEEYLALICQKESEHVPNLEYLTRLRKGDLNLATRNEAVHWILKVHAHLRFGPLCAYLSINYLDRFLSAYELPKGKAWMMQLLATTCLSLAAKMEETEVPLSLDLQLGECKYVFEARTIQRMELLVLSTLKWRMQAITPFSFIDHFLNKINNEEEIQPASLILKSMQLILSTVRGIDFLEFKPSEIAAAVAISLVGREIKTVDTEKAISALIQHVQKERVVKCIELIYEMSLIGEANGPNQSVPQSPIGVLDAAACLSYRSDDTNVGSCANSTQATPEAKRRKLNTQWEQV